MIFNRVRDELDDFRYFHFCVVICLFLLHRFIQHRGLFLDIYAEALALDPPALPF